MNKIEFENKFPYESVRDQQQEAIEFSLNSFLNDNKRFCIIEAGTGVGKSAIGLTVARVLQDHMKNIENVDAGSYFLTTQKILQDQYENDFLSISSLKASSNYKCSFHKRNTCSESQQLLRSEEKGTKFFNNCVYDCVYKNQKKKFLESRESVTNFPYFLTEVKL